MIRNCAVCSAEFHTWPYSIRNGHGKFCGLVCAGTSRLGKPNGRAGETRPYMRGENNPMSSAETRAKQKANVPRGEKHPAWRGGVTPLYKTIRKSPEYIAWRTAVYERDNYTCQECGLSPGQGKRVDLNADHIKPFSIYPELRFELDNGRTLCVPCHKKTSTYGGNILTMKKELTNAE